MRWHWDFCGGRFVRRAAEGFFRRGSELSLGLGSERFQRLGSERLLEPEDRRSSRQGMRRYFRQGMGRLSRQGGRVAGFTMLETLMVLLIGGMLLLAASSFLFGAITLRKQIEEAPQLGQHAASVARLLETLIASAAPQQGAAGGAASGGAGAGGSAAGSGGSAGGGAAGASAAGSSSGAAAGSSGGVVAGQVNWRELPSVVFGSGQALYLSARAGLPLFVGESGLVESTVNCYLMLEKGEGLVLFWQSERMRREDENDWERTLLSPLVTEASLLFYDAEREQWERSEGLEQPFTNPERLPQVIELVFSEPDGGRKVVTEVLLPPQATQLLGL